MLRQLDAYTAVHHCEDEKSSTSCLSLSGITTSSIHSCNDNWKKETISIQSLSSYSIEENCYDISSIDSSSYGSSTISTDDIENIPCMDLRLQYNNIQPMNVVVLPLLEYNDIPEERPMVNKKIQRKNQWNKQHQTQDGNGSSNVNIPMVLYDYLLSFQSLYSIFTQYIPIRSRRILDLGCGRSGVTKELVYNGYNHVFGVDISTSCIAFQLERSYNLRQFLKYLTMNASALHFRDRSMDVIFTKALFNGYLVNEGFKSYVERCIDGLKQIERVLRPGGIWIDVSSYANSFYDITKAIHWMEETTIAVTIHQTFSLLQIYNCGTPQNINGQHESSIQVRVLRMKETSMERLWRTTRECNAEHDRIEKYKQFHDCEIRRAKRGVELQNAITETRLMLEEDLQARRMWRLRICLNATNSMNIKYNRLEKLKSVETKLKALKWMKNNNGSYENTSPIHLPVQTNNSINDNQMAQPECVQRTDYLTIPEVSLNNSQLFTDAAISIESANNCQNTDNQLLDVESQIEISNLLCDLCKHVENSMGTTLISVKFTDNHLDSNIIYDCIHSMIDEIIHQEVMQENKLIPKSVIYDQTTTRCLNKPLKIENAIHIAMYPSVVVALKLILTR